MKQIHNDENDGWELEIKKLKEKGVPTPRELGLIDIPNSLRDKDSEKK